METKFIERDFEIDLKDILKLNKILVLSWPRRAWKTFLFYQIIKNAIEKNFFEIENIVYINFSNFLLKNFEIENFLESYFSLFPDKKPVFFLDEIQELENFDKILLFLQSNWYQVFATWSNSKLLSSEISTNLRWKYLEKFVLPLSFKEFLRFKNFENKKLILEEDIWKLNNLFVEFLNWGAFPEIVLAENLTTKRDLLNSYLNWMIYIDLIERYKIENEVVLRELIEKILLNIWKEFSVHKFFNNLKSKWIKISKNTIYNYINYLQNSFFISEIRNFYKNQNSKNFLYDVWFENLVLETANFWQRFENIVFLELKRKFNDIFYKLNWSELDFFVPEKNFNIQVCYELNEQNFEREIKVFKNWEKNYLIYFSKKWDFKKDWVEILSFFEFLEINN